MISKYVTAGAELDHLTDLLMTLFSTCLRVITVMEQSDISFLIKKNFSSTWFIKNFWRTIASLFSSLLVQSEQLSTTITKAD